MIAEQGFLIVATPNAKNEHRETVVLVAVHGSEGSLGFVVNRPSACSLNEALTNCGVPMPEAIDPQRTVWRGGPTRPDVGWLLFDAAEVDAPEDSCLLTPRVGVTAAPTAMESVIVESPSALLLLGHLTWEPEDLDDEIAAGAWLRTKVDPALLFEAPATRRWSDATCTVLELPRPWWGPARFALA
ncbi:MAG: YqgE/AlgH family protein [Myxococcota bacterium]